MDIPYIQIGLHFNTDQCTETCPPLLEYVEGYVNPDKNDGIVLAVMPMNDYANAEDFFMRAFGKNMRYQYRQVEKDGYSCRPLSVTERNNRLNELYAINTSASERQGGAMNETYFEYPKPMEQEKCPYHFQKIYGVFSPDNIWIGYLDLLLAGNWAATIHILGHQAYLDSCKKGSYMVGLWFCMVTDIFINHPSVKFIQYHMMLSLIHI